VIPHPLQQRFLEAHVSAELLAAEILVSENLLAFFEERSIQTLLFLGGHDVKKV